MITLQNVTKRYGPKVGVDNISLFVPKGCIYALLGPNGAGKSTTIRLITTLIKPDRGSINVAGHDVLKNPRGVRQHIGVVFQTPSLDDDLTVSENLRLHASMYSMGKRELLERSQNVISLMDLNAHRNACVKTLSGGLKRRVEISRALLHRPNIIFLDEPTIGLDTQTRIAMWQYLRTLNEEEGVTIVFTTHYLEEVEAFSEHVAIIDHGSIVAEGPIEDVKSSNSSSTLQDAYLKLTGEGPRE